MNGAVLAQLSIWAPMLMTIGGYFVAVARRSGAVPDEAEREREQRWAERGGWAFRYGLIATVWMIALAIIGI